DSPWNKDISGEPVDPESDTLIAGIGLDRNLHPDFGTVWQGAPSGIPYVVVPGDQPRVPVRFTAYGDESDPGPYPVPPDAPVEGGREARGRPPRPRPRPGQLDALRDDRRVPRRQGLEGRLGRHLRPEGQQVPPRRLDLGQRGRAAHPARPGPLRRGHRAEGDPARA